MPTSTMSFPSLTPAQAAAFRFLGAGNAHAVFQYHAAAVDSDDTDAALPPALIRRLLRLTLRDLAYAPRRPLPPSSPRLQDAGPLDGPSSAVIARCRSQTLFHQWVHAALPLPGGAVPPSSASADGAAAAAPRWWWLPPATIAVLAAALPSDLSRQHAPAADDSLPHEPPPVGAVAQAIDDLWTMVPRHPSVPCAPPSAPPSVGHPPVAVFELKPKWLTARLVDPPCRNCRRVLLKQAGSAAAARAAPADHCHLGLAAADDAVFQATAARVASRAVEHLDGLAGSGGGGGGGGGGGSAMAAPPVMQARALPAAWTATARWPAGAGPARRRLVRAIVTALTEHRDLWRRLAVLQDRLEAASASLLAAAADPAVDDGPLATAAATATATTWPTDPTLFMAMASLADSDAVEAMPCKYVAARKDTDDVAVALLSVRALMALRDCSFLFRFRLLNDPVAAVVGDAVEVADVVCDAVVVADIDLKPATKLAYWRDLAQQLSTLPVQDPERYVCGRFDPR
ncbi:hypothetical protein CXG81DRAFT_23588 [Caulochytrium protostelioides]|uniref:Inositol-pentakisphosphate 2-kinase n=1 Tax=Caulochytrium protostelioides TaxID=1555241 RepID=A0A4P9XE21_9FUNG|nr:hypothetical protein CXG81DRAFT_23588 [Caulochytrium protostelioides]|eukprot:RKP03753.1 hypothetical protein CXG81DRAFT_23588 [Caulochytrium protostelioides]